MWRVDYSIRINIEEMKREAVRHGVDIETYLGGD